MTGCIYHEADLDGVMSAAIVKRRVRGSNAALFVGSRSEVSI